MPNAQKISDLSAFVLHVQDKLAIEQKRRIRYWDKKTPSGIHPLWCAMTMLTETNLPKEVRENGWQALLLHDVLEDTTAGLPKGLKPKVKKLVEELTAFNPQEEWDKVWFGSDEAKLLKLYDTTSNLLDSKWMEADYRKLRIKKVKKLLAFVKEKYGDLNITMIADSVCKRYK